MDFCQVHTCLSAFMKHHEMPVTSDAMIRLHGARLWQSKQSLVPDDQRDASKISPGGIVSLAIAFNHGFTAPTEAQHKFLAFLQSLSH